VALDRYHREFEKNPTVGLKTAWRKLWSVQTELAEFLGGNQIDLFLRHNVTSVLNEFIFGIPLPDESEILVGEHEYSAIVNICRLRAERENLKLRILKMPASLATFRKLTRPKLIDQILSQLSQKTKLLVLSHVIAGTGLCLPIEEISKATRQRGIFFVIDGVYAPGALRINFSSFNHIDFYGCSLYKWMMGPKGTAFGWVAPRNQKILKPIHGGWTTFEANPPFSDFGEGSFFQHQFLISGCHDFAPFFAIHEMLSLWKELGPSFIRERLQENHELLCRRIHEKLGWPRLATMDPTLNGPLLVFVLPEKLQKDSDKLQSFFLERFHLQINTVCLNGIWHVIFSPHFYDSEEDIERCVAVLDV